MIRFRQIEAFRHLMSSGTTVGAAKRMHITQPAISRLINDLEDDLGFKLFHRVKGRLEPTTAGVRFHRAVEENFLGLERLRKAAETIREDEHEGLSIACMPVLATTLLPLILKEFFKLQPNVPVKVDSIGNSELLVQLQDMKVDVGISAEFASIAGIEVESIYETDPLCALPPGHRLIEKDKIYPEDLADETIIGWLPGNALSHGDEDKTYFGRAGVRPKCLIRTYTSHIRYAMVASGFGVSIVEPFASSVWRAHGVVVKPYQTDVKHRYVLAYPSAGSRSGVLQDFRTATLIVAEQLAGKQWTD
ncbi:LysR family transcriptional regulator [Leeia sp. TBRC 13508]|uniref:LysR family transcriptional regulator n=1 Tax=Leeia speluncae TaxID=2884804 RepID=A0ABS8D5B5_9NEIS|nr:LysR substrate-binding domain-containing protein [Leeia speluncae]MCB6183362.1 LysR family transcriptional regulator [Leeia speluncae]